MGWRFRKSIKILPGVKVNIGKKSVGLSIGSKLGGISLNSKNGARSRISIPGTGIHFSSKLFSGKRISKAEKIAMLEQIDNLLTQTAESANLVNTTLKPDVFFHRLNFMLDTLQTLTTYEDKYRFNNLPSADYQRAIDNLEATVNNFIDRSFEYEKEQAAKLKTEKGKLNRMLRYFDKMEAAFENSHTFWGGNEIYQHYDGPLFTDNNIDKLAELKASYIQE